MFEEINKLSDFLLRLFHASYVIKLHLDISHSLYFVALLGVQLGHDGVRSHSSENIDSQGYPKERTKNLQSVPKGLTYRILLMVKIDFGLLEPPNFIGFDHRKQVIDVAVVPEMLGSAVVILKYQLEFVAFLRLNFHYFHFFQTFE